MAFIEINNLEFTYPLEKKESLMNINLSLEKNSFLLIAGKSGSGKSTLARAIVGTVPNFYGGTIGGEIKIDGKTHLIADLSTNGARKPQQVVCKVTNLNQGKHIINIINGGFGPVAVDAIIER